MTRELAFEILRSGHDAPTRLVPEFAQRAGLDARDRGLLARMVRTEVQRRGTLHALVRAFANSKPNRDVSALLRLGFTQLFFMDRIPDHAAVSETVRATSNCLGLAKGRFVNGVLRTALRAKKNERSGDARRDLVGRELSFAEPVFADPAEHPYLWAEEALSLPAPLYRGWVSRFGEAEARELAEACLADPRLSLRVVRGERDALAQSLQSRGVASAHGQHAAILTIAPEDLEGALASEEFLSGQLTVQGESALRAAELCRARSGERWLDMCAAPGGKTAVLAATGASIVASDVSASKLERLRETLERLGSMNGVETRLVAEDDTSNGDVFGAAEFDGVLLDAPCSNTGVLARRPEARWRFGPKTRKTLASLQSSLLERAATVVRPGGALVYSTCSIEPDENEQRVRAFLEAHPDWSLEEQLSSFPRPAQLEGPVDGGFAARLVRKV